MDGQWIHIFIPKRENGANQGVLFGSGLGCCLVFFAFILPVVAWNIKFLIKIISLLFGFETEINPNSFSAIEIIGSIFCLLLSIFCSFVFIKKEEQVGCGLTLLAWAILVIVCFIYYTFSGANA